jgi:hypothetical protein
MLNSYIKKNKMKKNIFKYVLVPIMILCAFGINFFNAQNWTTVWTENFNGLPHSSSYNNGVTGYWNNSANPPQNSQISGTFEATPANGIVAGTTQVPSDAAGGRFLMFWTQGGVAIPTSENVFFKKTMTVVPGKTYRINYRLATLGAVPGTATNRANTTFKVSQQGVATPFYTSTTVIADVNAWKNLQYEFTVPSSVTSIDMIWENTTKATTGNDFALDDLVLQEAVDSDGDGIPDYIDGDDDNDGILDTDEGKCNRTARYRLDQNATIAGATINPNGGSFNLVFTLESGGTPVPSIGNQFTIPFSYSGMSGSSDLWEGINSIGTASFAIRPNTNSLYTGLPANNSTSETAAEIYPDPIFNELLSTNKINQLGTYSVTIGSPPVPVSTDLATLSQDEFTLHSAWNLTYNGTNYTSGYYSRLTIQNDLVDYGNFAETEYLSVKYGNTYTYLYTAFSNTPGSGAGNGGNRGFIQLRDVIVEYCLDRDTDGDGTPDYLDLDSDGDGCPDAREGAGNFNPATTASGTIATQTPNTNFGTVVNPATGIPTAVGAGQAVGQSQDTYKNDCLDSDGDLVPNWQDLDDDNDGILDTNEQNCLSPISIGVNPNPIASENYGGATATYTEVLGSVNTYSFGGYNGFDAAGYPSRLKIDYSVNFINYAFRIADLDNLEKVRVSVYDKNGILVSNITPYITYQGGNVLATAQSGISVLVESDTNSGGVNNSFNSNIYIDFKLPFEVSRIDFDFYDRAGAGSSPEYYFLEGCVVRDIDNDGIPNYLDLDSDADGCSDALEGGANINATQLVTAGGSVSGGSTTVSQNLCGGAGCVNAATGIPQFATLPSGYSNATGQSVGDSQNNLVNGCYCYKLPEKVTGNPNPVKHGITALNRANSGTSDWPVVRQSAWTVLESKTKGFVLNRMAFVDADSNTATPTTPPLASIPAANYVEGMMVYDTVAKCLKIYNGTIWSCFSTQTCPD